MKAFTKFHIITLALVLLSAAFAIALPSGHALADSSDVNVDCVVTHDDIAAIKAIQDNVSLSYNEKMAQELAARKTLLARIITCAGSELSSLRDAVSGVSPSGTAEASIQVQLASKIDDAANYYDLERAKLADSGIVGTKQVAREITAWRVSMLAPLTDQIDHFVLWSENQPLFVSATARMAQVSRIVSFLAATNDNDLATAFNQAQTSFHAAQDQNIATGKAIAQSLASDEVSTLMRQSLQSLAETYQRFFSISTIIQGVTSQPAQK